MIGMFLLEVPFIICCFLGYFTTRFQLLRLRIVERCSGCVCERKQREAVIACFKVQTADCFSE
jgi:hypothetical protein